MTNCKEKRLNRGRFYESLLVQHDDGRREVVKLLAVPSDLDLLQVHLDDLAEINHMLMDPDDGGHQLIIPSQVDLFDRTVIVRRPYVDGCLAQMFSMLLVDPGFKGKLDVMVDGRVLEDWQLRWVAYQLIMALQLMHQAGLTHGSLQTSNVLVDASLTVSLVDVAPYKPFYLGADDPTMLLYYYDQEHVRYVAPERFETSVSSDLLARQRADVYGLAVILRHLFGPTEAVTQLMKTRSLAEFPPLFPKSSSALSSVILPLIRHWTVLGFDGFEEKLDDLKVLSKDDDEIAKILCQFLIGQLQKAKNETEILRILAYIKDLYIKCNSLVFYLEAVKGLGVSEAISKACNRILGHAESKAKTSRSGTSTGQILRRLVRLCDSDVTRLDLLEALSLLYPTVLVHPSGKVRRAAVKLLTKISSSSVFDEVDKLALMNQIFAKVLLPSHVDPTMLSYESISPLLKEPLSQDLFELVKRNIDQLPLFMSALAPEDAEKVSLIAPLLKSGKDEEMALLARKVLKVNPILSSPDEDHASFSPVLSDVESQGGAAIPIGTDPVSHRHFQRRRLPFQFSEYHHVVCSSNYVALMREQEIEVWRMADFRREILPEPWLTVPNAKSSLVLRQNRMALYSEESIMIFNLERNTVELEFECDKSIVKMTMLENGLLACNSRLTKYVDGKVEWQSEAQPAHHGYIKELLVGPGEIFVVTTTCNGYISLWDLRYGLCLRSWRIPLSLGTIHGASLCPSEDPSVVLPPRIWIISSTEETGVPCVMVVDLSAAQITHSTERSLEGLELLEDAEYPIRDIHDLPLPFCHPEDAEWTLVCDGHGQIYRCALGPETIEMEPLHTSLKHEPVQSICVTCPTSAESSRNLSIMLLTLTGQCYIIECFR